MDYALQTDRLCKNYRHYHALNGLTMNVPRGSIYGIELRFPVYYDGQEGNEIRMPDKNTVETVVLMSRIQD